MRLRSLAVFTCVALAALSTTPPASAAPPVAAAPRRPEVWAVVIGIDRYRDPAIPGCRGTIRDGSELARWLTQTATWGSDHVLLMNENGSVRPGRPEDPLRALVPTRTNLEWALREWLGHRVRSGDVAVIYYAGQAAAADGRELLLPLDARAESLAKTGWSPEEAIDDLALGKNASVVLWLDTSPWGRGASVPRREADPSAGIRMLNRLTRWPSVTAWLASEGRPSAEGTDRSPFLAALLDGLGQRPNNLLACLDRMQQDSALKQQGFRVRGGIPPDLTLWPRELLPPHQFKPVLLLQHGHADAVSGLAMSADGEQLISASRDSTVRLWRVRDRERTLLQVLPGHLIGVTALALSPDGRLVTSGDGAGRVRVWDLAEQREKRYLGLTPHVQRVVSLAYVPDRQGARFASLDQDGRSMIWTTTGPTLQVKPLVATAVVRMAGATREGPSALALAAETGSVALLDAEGQPIGPPLEGTGGRPSALDLDGPGARVAVGDEEGRVRVWDVARRALVFRHDYGARIGSLRLGRGAELVVASESRLFLADLGGEGPGLALQDVGDDVDAVSYSPDGRWLAALERNGDARLWDLADRAHPVSRRLEMAGRSAGLTCLEFSRDGRRLVAGEGDGGIRAWDLPGRRERPRIAPHRGKVLALSVSADGRYLLEVTQDRLALVWDLKEGRGARALPGRWTAGFFLAAGDQAALIRAADEGGDIVLVDRASGAIRKTLARPLAPGGRQVSRARFARLAVSRDGRTVAAITAPGQAEFACVWHTDGRSPRTFRGHTAPLSGLDLSADGRWLLTSSEDATVRVWDLAAAEAGHEPPPSVLQATPGRALTAARFHPADAATIVTAQLAPNELSEVRIWERRAGGARTSRTLGEVPGRVHTIALTDDGRWLGTAGQDGAVSLWTLDPKQAPARVVIDPVHQHTEQVNALIAWPGIPMLASGSDDTTVRLWGLDAASRRGALIGTLSADPPALDAPARPLAQAAPVGSADWVAFTPEGVYDSSLNGDRTVSFVVGREVRPLEQYAEMFHKFQLTDDLRKGASPPPPKHTPPPILVIDPPPTPDLAGRDVELRISLADPTLQAENLRLYQNGVPVQDGGDFQSLDAPGRFAARVRLRSGVNRFYAMAGRTADIDARSQDVELRFDGPDAPGRVHVIALGVKDYNRNALRFADRDAAQIANFLHRNGLQTANQPGEIEVLTDRNVTEKSLEDRFTALRGTVKGHPEDTVVVFLAGHTDVLKDPTGRERFTLLLPSYPFPEDAPLMASNRGAVAGTGAVRSPKLPAGSDLPFYVVYRHLTHLDALQRLIIVDACQAEAIYNDPGVRTIQRVMEKETHRARVSYLLAARRGEPANESTVLEHGLLTYVLLRGMQAPGLRSPEVPLPVFEQYPNADDDRDGIVTTRELRLYADRTLPALAGQLPDLARRAGPAVSSAVPPSPSSLALPLPLPSPSPVLPPLRIQADDMISFGIATLTRAREPGE